MKKSTIVIALFLTAVTLLLIELTTWNLQSRIKSLENEVAAQTAQSMAMQMPVVIGKVYVDTNSNGALDTNDQPAENLTIDIYADGSPDPVGRTITDGSGTYTFRVNPGKINGMGIQNTEGWDVTWLTNWPIITESQGVYLGPIIFLNHAGKG